MHFFSLLRGAKWYYKAIYLASFTGYEDDILEVISNLHIEGAKFGGKKDKFGGNLLKNWTLRSSWSPFFPSLIQCLPYAGFF